jgi:hypothetical protein
VVGARKRVACPAYDLALLAILMNPADIEAIIDYLKSIQEKPAPTQPGSS